MWLDGSIRVHCKFVDIPGEKNWHRRGQGSMYSFSVAKIGEPGIKTLDFALALTENKVVSSANCHFALYQKTMPAGTSLHRSWADQFCLAVIVLVVAMFFKFRFFTARRLSSASVETTKSCPTNTRR
jgi:hypothetical protein